jgi:DedD protein
MAFFKFRARGPQGNEGRSAVAAAPAESIEAMRRRARHRLLGAAVLVLVGVIGFPLLFDTQPRPIPVDIPIEIPDRNKAKPLALPAAPAPARGDARPAAAAPPSSGGMITESADGTEIPTGKVAAASPEPEPRAEPAPDNKAPKAESRAESRTEPKPRPEPKPEPRPEPKAEAKAEPKPAAPKPPTNEDAARARALLEGKPSTVAAAATAKEAEEAGRFVVQVGAFADADKAREVRQKLEKAGLKTFTSVAKTADGERTRVRVGPFGNRAEADRAAAKVKGLSLSAAVLSL